jgi:hypothetical protein
MITASQIQDLRRADSVYQNTSSLINRIAKLKSERRPFFLTACEFDDILKWKLKGQYGRQEEYRAMNSDEVIRAVTGLALAITHENEDYELELRVNILCSLRGVAVPVASAVLTLVYPTQYAVIDFRNWRQIFGERKNGFSIHDYKQYMEQMRRLANELNWTVQEVDLAIQEYDYRHDGDAQQIVGRERR